MNAAQSNGVHGDEIALNTGMMRADPHTHIHTYTCNLVYPDTAYIVLFT